jgi:hypothetical protein
VLRAPTFLRISLVINLFSKEKKKVHKKTPSLSYQQVYLKRNKEQL